VNNSVEEAKTHLTEDDQLERQDNIIDNVQKGVDTVIEAPKNWKENRRKKQYEKDKQKHKEHTENLREKYNIPKEKKKKSSGWFS